MTCHLSPIVSQMILAIYGRTMHSVDYNRYHLNAHPRSVPQSCVSGRTPVLELFMYESLTLRNNDRTHSLVSHSRLERRQDKPVR